MPQRTFARAGVLAGTTLAATLGIFGLAQAQAAPQPAHSMSVPGCDETMTISVKAAVAPLAHKAMDCCPCCGKHCEDCCKGCCEKMRANSGQKTANGHMKKGDCCKNCCDDM